jgi:diaminopimelate epimerase
MRLAFAKYQGLGNDFIIVDAERAADVGPAQAISLCDRHLGVGADGVLLVDTRGPRPSMRVINADGSVPEMCGNGIRCVALYLHRRGAGAAVLIDTDAGPHACEMLSDVLGVRGAALVTVAMRPGTLVPERIPVLASAPMVDAPFEIEGHSLHLTAVSMGNPHAVSFDDVGELRLALGPAIGRDRRFPQGVNVGFARQLGSAQLELAVFERGSGWTQACGTGACAAAIAAVETGRARRGVPIEVRLPGGVLSIAVSEPDQPVSMTGPARCVFEGLVELDLD